MLKITKGEFEINGGLFSLPDNVCIDNVGELEGADAIRIAPIGENIYIEIAGHEEEESSKESFLDDEIFEECAWHSEVQPITSGGLSGHYILYECKRENYCEYRYDLDGDTDENTMLYVIICSWDKKVTPEGLRNHPAVVQLIGSIHRAE